MIPPSSLIRSLLARSAPPLPTTATLKSVSTVVEVFLSGLENAGVSDSVFEYSLEVVRTLLPGPAPAPVKGTDGEMTSAKQDKKNTPASTAAVVVSTGAYGAILEVVMGKAAAAFRRSAHASTDQSGVAGMGGDAAAEKQRKAKELFERVFAKAPAAWRSKFKLKEDDAPASRAAGRRADPATKGPRISIRVPKRKEAPAAGGGRGGSSGGSGDGSSSGGGRTSKKRVKR